MPSIAVACILDLCFFLLRVWRKVEGGEVEIL